MAEEDGVAMAEEAKDLTQEQADNPPMQKKARKDWICCNFAFAAYVEAGPGSNVFRDSISGFWLKSEGGQATLRIDFAQEGLPVCGPVRFNDGAPQGNGTLFSHPSGSIAASIAFDFQARERYTKPHLLTEILPGVFRSGCKHLAWICPGRFDPCPGKSMSVDKGVITIPVVNLPFCLSAMQETYGKRIWKVFAWLNAGKDLEYLIVFETRQVLWCNHDGTSSSDRPTGKALYHYIKDGTDAWYFEYHWSGNEGKAKRFLFVRVVESSCADSRIWRCNGREYKKVLALLKSQGAFPDLQYSGEDSCGMHHILLLELLAV